MLTKKVEKPATRRAVVGYLVEHHPVSERRACRLLGLSRSVARTDRRHGVSVITQVILLRWHTAVVLQRILERLYCYMHIKLASLLIADSLYEEKITINVYVELHKSYWLLL